MVVQICKTSLWISKYFECLLHFSSIADFLVRSPSRRGSLSCPSKFMTSSASLCLDPLLPRRYVHFSFLSILFFLRPWVFLLSSFFFFSYQNIYLLYNLTYRSVIYTSPSSLCNVLCERKLRTVALAISVLRLTLYLNNIALHSTLLLNSGAFCSCLHSTAEYTLFYIHYTLNSFFYHLIQFFCLE